jgi:hypothetical protein
MAIGESIFDLAYLCTVLTLGVRMIRRGGKKSQYRLFGIMAVTLGAGDAFHLLPRVAALCTDGLARHTAALGIGKFITSLTMTAFYVLLYAVWRRRYAISGHRGLTAAVWLLAAARVVLCLFPQNGWTSPHPSLAWGIWRNLPFTALGAVLIVLFWSQARRRGDRPFGKMWLAIAVSFACYLPVVLLADRFPPVGALMLPKTCAYVWAVWIGYRDMNMNEKRSAAQ